jgi:transcription elongation factor SPT5
MGLVDSGKIKPVIYRERCRGLEELPRALEDLSARKVWGRGVLRINEGGEEEEKAKL